MRNKSILVRFAVVLGLALALSSVISSYFLGKNMLNENIEFMMKTISVVDYSLDYEKPLQDQVKRLYTDALDGDTRLTIIDTDGNVLADTDLDSVDKLENHLEREEVKEALKDGKGYATRYSQSLGIHQLYVASFSEDAQMIIRMSVPYKNVLDYMMVLLPLLLVGVVIAFVISVTVVARITNNMNSDEMKRQMEQMEKDKKIRQEFFSNASHELKTPITSVRGYAELLTQDFVKDKATRKDFLGRILKETDHMTSLIDDILMISRLESKDAEVTLSKVQMKAVLKEVLESLQPQANNYQVTIWGESEEIAIQASVQQMRELFLNLISNGIKYNHPGGHVWTRVWQGRDAVYIEVKDDGVGIEKEDQVRVFERFFRVDKGRSRKMGGTGLGLSIVKHITAYYGGQVSLTSEPGKGSCFLVEIPLSGINKV
ncbi:MAG: two-component sensor histidine kinase [Lachnospiraceae bacterium]|nr:two-component sensor histidine kinase [Lachnospiraceae bacterium]